MLVNLPGETVVELRRARFPGRPSRATVWRWVNRGVRGVRLEVFRCGGKIFTTEESISRFIERLSGDRFPLASATELSAATRRAHELAEKKLDAAGI